MSVDILGRIAKVLMCGLELNPEDYSSGFSLSRLSRRRERLCQESSQLRAGSDRKSSVHLNNYFFSLYGCRNTSALATPTLELRSKSISGRKAFEGQKNTPCLPVRTCLFHEKHTFPSVWSQKRRFFRLSSLFLLNLQDKQGDKMC